MPASIYALAGSFDADKIDILIINKWMEDSDGIAAATDTGQDIIWKLSFFIYICFFVSSPIIFWKSLTISG